MTHLPIRLLRCPGIKVAEETVFASRNVSTLLSFAPHPCRERIYPFRLLHLPPLSISDTQQKFRHCLPLAELEGKMPLAADEV